MNNKMPLENQIHFNAKRTRFESLFPSPAKCFLFAADSFKLTAVCLIEDVAVG